MTLSSPIARGLLSLIAIVVTSLDLHAQCFDWASGFHDPSAGGNGLSDTVFELEVVDLGTGPALYAGGYFNNAGGVAAEQVARWDGTSWSPLGSGLDGTFMSDTDCVRAFQAYDDGSGPALYAGGVFHKAGSVPASNIARWNGSSWSALGSGASYGSFDSGAVHALAVFDDGTGRALYAAGSFSVAGGLDANAIAKWNGVSWSTLGAGVGNDIHGYSGQVFALAVHDDGSGPALFAGGTFRSAGGVSAGLVAKWDGAAWHALGGGLAGTATYVDVSEFTVFDDGSGPKLYAGGRFQVSGAPTPIARWDGSTWTAVTPPTSLLKTALALTVFDDGAGPALYAAGDWNGYFGPYPGGIGRFDGSSWSPVGGGAKHLVHTLEAFDDGVGPGATLYVGGSIILAGGLPSSGIAAWRACTSVGTPYCFGDGSLTTPCPCAPPDTVPVPSGAPDSGCANSFRPSGAKLVADGATNQGSVRLRVTSQSPGGYTVLLAGTGTEPGGVAYHDGVRCAGGSFVRFGAQFATGGGVVYPNLAFPGLVHPLHVVSGVTPGSGQTRYYQSLYRDNAPGFCSAGTLNLSNAVSIVW